jgi:transcriptional regulator with XRE-family HTH domain
MAPKAAKASPALEPEQELRVGETLRRIREQAGWSIQRLGREAHVSPAAVYKIEKGRMVPSVTVLLKIAKALNRTVADLLDQAEEQSAQVLRADQRQEFRFAELPISLQRIAGSLPDRQLEAGIYVVEKGASSTPAPVTHAGEEIYFVLEGRIRFEVDGRVHQLGAGDTLHLKGTVPHRWENAADGTSRLLFVLTPPSFKNQRRSGEHGPVIG